MALRIVWTGQAKKGLQLVLDYLAEDWTIAAIMNLENRLSEFMDRISKHPEIHPASDQRKDLRKGIVDKNNYVVYRVKKDNGIIEIIHFRGTKQKPLY